MRPKHHWVDALCCFQPLTPRTGRLQLGLMLSFSSESGGVCYVAVDNQTPGHSSITPCVRYEVPGSHTPRLPCVAKEVQAALCKDHRQRVTLTVGAASCKPHQAVAAGHSVDPGLESRAPPPLLKGLTWGWKTGRSTERSDVRVSGGHTRHPWPLRTRKEKNC